MTAGLYSVTRSQMTVPVATEDDSNEQAEASGGAERLFDKAQRREAGICEKIRERGDESLAALSCVCHGVIRDGKWLLSEPPAGDSANEAVLLAPRSPICLIITFFTATGSML